MSLCSRHKRCSSLHDTFYDDVKSNCEKTGMELSKENIEKLFTIMVSTAADYLYHNPECRIDLPHFSIIRTHSKSNLIHIDIKRDKEVRNAEQLLYFYLNEGLEKRKLKNILDEFVDTLVEYSADKEEQNSDIIKTINSSKKSKKGH